MKKTANQKQINKGKWRVYNRTPRRFRLSVSNLFTGEITSVWCNEDKFSDTFQSLADKYQEDSHTQIHVYEVLDVDFDDQGA